MDFKTQVTGAAGLAGVAADALLLLVAGQAVPDDLEAPLADALGVAVKQGDVDFKPGHTLYAHRVAGVKAARVVFAAMGDGSLRIASWKAFESAADSAVWWRQTPACLAENGKLHPALYDENTNWGAAIGGSTVVRRSAAGLDPARKILFVAVSNATSPRALAIGMMHTGASDVAQLDINYSYPRFLVFGGTSEEPRISEGLIKDLKWKAEDYTIEPSTRDFFYVVRKKPVPPA